MKKVKMLQKLIEQMNDLIGRASDQYHAGYNIGLQTAVQLIEDKIGAILSAKD